MKQEDETNTVHTLHLSFHPQKPYRVLTMAHHGSEPRQRACCSSGSSGPFRQRRIEVVTTAVSAVTSYTLLDFVDEIIEQSPDAVVIYAGHNEYVGLLGVGSGSSIARRPAVIWTILRVRQSSRVFQLLEAGVAYIQLVVAKLPGTQSGVRSWPPWRRSGR